MNHCYHKQMLGTVVVCSSFISVTQVRSLFAAYFFSSELLHSRLIFFSELIHLYKTFNTSWNNKKWCSAVERWVPHILRTRDRIPLFLCFLFIPGACSPPFFYHRWARLPAMQAAWAPRACSLVFLFTFSFQ